MNLQRLAFILCVLVLAGEAAAQVEPVVQVEVSPESVTVGEPVELRITVLVPTWFPQPPVYPSFELANAITRLPENSSFPVRQRIGRESWSGIVRNYRIYPLLGATYRLDGQTMKVTYANPGADPVVMDVNLPEVVFTGTVPPGAEALDPYVAGRRLSLTLDVDGNLDELKAGDAIVLEYAAELDGLPAIFLPSLAPGLALDGVSVYADEPRVESGTPARRSEKITLVFDAGGEFSFPDAELRYWNSDSASIETVRAAGFSVSVEGPVVAAVEAEVVTSRSWRTITLIAGLLLCLLYLLTRLAPFLARKYRAAEVRRTQSEAYAFRLLRKALKAGNAKPAYHAMLVWLDRLAPGLEARRFVAEFGDDALRRNLDALGAGLYSDGKTTADFGVLENRLAAARAGCLQSQLGFRGRGLPPMNP